MKEYLIETFHYNLNANIRLLEKIKMLPDKTESIKFFSHLINCQYRWMARITHDPIESQMSWWTPVYPLDELELKWKQSIKIWTGYISEKTIEELSTEVIYNGTDGGKYAATPLDIALQLNYHSIHHRAQVQTLIRQQGLEPDFLDYIGTKFRKLS
jgi:uncharacterized damage-inducible protein DinB